MMLGLDVRLGAWMQHIAGPMIGLAVAAVPYTTDGDVSFQYKFGLHLTFILLASTYGRHTISDVPNKYYHITWLCMAIMSFALALYFSIGYDPLWLHVLARIPPAATAILMAARRCISHIWDPMAFNLEPFSFRFNFGHYMIYVGPVEHGPDIRKSYTERRSPNSQPWSIGLQDDWRLPVSPSVPESSIPSAQSIHLSDVATLSTSHSLRRDLRRIEHGGSSSQEGTDSGDSSQSPESEQPQPWVGYSRLDTLHVSELSTSNRSADISSSAGHSGSG